MADPDAEVTALTQTLIRNACVNDGAPESGEEARNVDVVASVLDGAGLDYERYETGPGRDNLVARIEGSDPDAESILWLAHTDVVPVNEAGWSRDPFGGEIVDGELWGRGAIDMLNMTASMAVSLRRLADSGFRPRGTLVYAAVADEEAGGVYGARHLAARERDAVAADYVITESGGFPIPTPTGLGLPVPVAERGTLWSRLIVRGTPGHGSMPFRTDNALVKAGEVVRRIGTHHPRTRIVDEWRSMVEALGMPTEAEAALLTEDGFVDTCGLLPLGIARLAYSCTRTTVTPTMMQAGAKLNVIPDTVEIMLDIRTLPGDGPAEVQAFLDEALGDLAGEVELELGDEIPGSASPTGTPLWEAFERVARGFYPESRLVPIMSPGATDARFFRPLGIPSYGFGLFSTRLSLDDLATMAHGDDERVDLESLALMTEMWQVLARDFLD
jgi:acetylornithine deacetylase/succinyl-diaminopimelate desuccinylase-like protein